MDFHPIISVLMNYGIITMFFYLLANPDEKAQEELKLSRVRTKKNI
jgi:hypothetical protein